MRSVPLPLPLPLLLLLAASCGRVGFGYPVVPCEEVIGNGSLLADDHCYTRHDLMLDHADAARTCMALGGHLATISSADENLTIASGLGLAAPAWIGLTNGSPDSTSWSWVTGEPAPYASWRTGEPMLCAGQVTPALLASDGLWTGGCRMDGHPFICEIEPWLVRANGHAYRISWMVDDWFAAKAACETMGGYLATITSQDERAFVAPLITTRTWLGASGPGDGTFTWLTGEPFDFASWNSNEPAAGTQCVLSNGDQQLFGADCALQEPALCERE